MDIIIGVTILIALFLAIIFFAFVHDLVSYFLIASIIIIALIFLEGIISTLFWIESIREILTTIEAILGSVIFIKLMELILY